MDFSEHLPRLTPPSPSESDESLVVLVKGLTDGASSVRPSDSTKKALNIAQRKGFIVNEAYLKILNDLDDEYDSELSPFPTDLEFQRFVRRLFSWEKSPLGMFQFSLDHKQALHILSLKNPQRKQESLEEHYKAASKVSGMTRAQIDVYRKKRVLRQHLLSARARRQLLLTSFDIAQIYKGYTLYYSTLLDYRLRMYPLEYLLSRTSGPLKRMLKDDKPTTLTLQGLLNLCEGYYSFDKYLLDTFKRFRSSNKFSKKTGKKLIKTFFQHNKVACLTKSYPYVKMLELEITRIMNDPSVMKTDVWVEIDQNASGLVLMAILFRNKGLAMATGLIPNEGDHVNDIYLFVRDKSKVLVSTYVEEFLAETDCSFTESDFSDVVSFFTEGSISRKVHKYALMCFCYNETGHGRTDRWKTLFEEHYNRSANPEEMRLIVKVAHSYPNIIDESFPKLSKQKDLINKAVKLTVQYVVTKKGDVDSDAAKVEHTPVHIRTLDGAVLSWDFTPLTSVPRKVYNPVTNEYVPVRFTMKPRVEAEVKKARRVRVDKHLRCFMPNFIHSIDGAIMRMIILQVYEKTKYTVNHLHDCILINPNYVCDLMDVIVDIYTSDQLNNLTDTLLFDQIRPLLDNTGRELLAEIEQEFDSLKDDFTISKDFLTPWKLYSYEAD